MISTKHYWEIKQLKPFSVWQVVKVYPLEEGQALRMGMVERVGTICRGVAASGIPSDRKFVAGGTVKLIAGE